MQKIRKYVLLINSLLLLALGITLLVYSFKAFGDFKIIENLAKKLFYALGKTDASTEYKPLLMMAEAIVGLVLSRGIISVVSAIYFALVIKYDNAKFEEQKPLVRTVAIVVLLFGSLIFAIAPLVLSCLKIKEEKIETITETKIIKESENGGK